MKASDVSGDAVAATPGSGRRVAVFGGGPGGLTAAHELAERGFEVDLYERHDVLGGKVRSFSLPDTGTDGRAGLPAEMGPHGIFSGYQHLGETMGRIPIGDGRTVLDNLTVGWPRHQMRLGWGGDAVTVPAGVGSLRGLREMMKPRTMLNLVTGAVKFQRKLTLRDEAILASKSLALVTSGRQRLWGQLEELPLVDFFQADQLSANANELLVFLLEANTEPADRMNARAFANSLVCIFVRGLLEPGPGYNKVGHLMTGPTNEVFFDPWTSLLRDLGARIHTGQRVTSLSCEQGRITSATVRDAAETETRVEADYYVLAVPADKAAELMNEDMVAADPALGRIALIEETWLGAMQIYLKNEAPELGMAFGPVDSPWSIGCLKMTNTTWDRDFPACYGDGTVVENISVDLASWDRPGILYGMTAKECTPEEMFEEIRAQLRSGLGDDTVLADEDIHSWCLNPSLSKPEVGLVINDEPEFATTPGCWQNQPDAVTKVPNLFLSASYVRTTLGVDSMDCANEAGRRAANGILAAAGSTAPRAYVATTDPPRVLKLLWALDDRRYQRGKRNAFDVVAPHRGGRRAVVEPVPDSRPAMEKTATKAG